MVRQFFLNCLSTVQTLKKWSNSDEFKPGICYEIISVVADVVKNKRNSGTNVAFNLTSDEMAIKQLKEWKKMTHYWSGLVDYGGQLSEDESDNEIKTALKAFVFIFVIVNGSFKVPVAHFLIHSLNGVKKETLLKNILVNLSSKEIIVVGVTFDSDPAHKSACESLGAVKNYK